MFGNYQGRYQQRFAKVFRHVQGRDHGHIKNGQDWLRYVFERWFFIDGFLAEESIGRFWHFDSDTMVLKDLSSYDMKLGGVDFSVQCNGTCLNGVMNSAVVAEYCEHICHLFENEDFLAAQQHEFDTIHPAWAFTEMRAFDDYKSSTPRLWLHLLHYCDDQVFDDCICQEHGFQMCSLPSGEMVKQVVSRAGGIWGTRDGREVEFVTLNLSWVPDYVFSWVMACLDGSHSRIDQARCSFRQSVRGVAKKMKRFVEKKVKP